MPSWSSSPELAQSPSDTSFRREYRIAVVGAGLVGLVLSIVIRRAGFSVDCFDEDAELKEVRLVSLFRSKLKVPLRKILFSLHRTPCLFAPHYLQKVQRNRTDGKRHNDLDRRWHHHPRQRLPGPGRGRRDGPGASAGVRRTRLVYALVSRGI